MKVDKKLINHVAKIARLKLTDSEISSYVNDFKEILDLFSKIEKEKVEGELAIHPIPPDQRLREDKVKKSLSKKEVFSNSKEKEGKFMGPKIK